MNISLLRRVAVLILAVVAGLVGVLLISSAIRSDQLHAAANLLVQTAGINEPAVDYDATGRMPFFNRFGLFVFGLLHLAVAAVALWPRDGLMWSGASLTMESEGVVVKVKHSVIEAYVLRIVRSVPGIKKARSHVAINDNNVQVRVRAEFDMEQGNVPDLSRKLRHELRQKMVTAIGQEAIASIDVEVARLIPSQAGKRTVVNQDRVEESEAPIGETEAAPASDAPTLPETTPPPPMFGPNTEPSEEPAPNDFDAEQVSEDAPTTPDTSWRAWDQDESTPAPDERKDIDDDEDDTDRKDRMP